ncbi:MAG: signal peptidase II [Gammaproteobacteria bacterium]
MTKKSCLRWCWLSLVVIVLDQLLKYWAAQQLALYQPKVIWPFFNLTLMHNTGAAFSFLSQQPQLALFLFAGIAIVVSLILVIWLYKTPAKRRWTACAIAFVLGGALGNLIDRGIHGYVIDFIELHYRGWYFPAFNVADTAITIGAVMLLIEAFFVKRHKR